MPNYIELRLSQAHSLQDLTNTVQLLKDSPSQLEKATQLFNQRLNNDKMLIPLIHAAFNYGPGYSEHHQALFAAFPEIQGDPMQIEVAADTVRSYLRLVGFDPSILDDAQ